MSNLLEILAHTNTATQQARDLIGRVPALQFAIVTNINDPLNMRRIKVTVASKGAMVESDWALAMRLIPDYDPPLPRVGTSVMVGAIDGDAHDLVWFGPVLNDTNPADDGQSNPADDSSLKIPGDCKELIQGGVITEVGKDLSALVKGLETRRTDKALVISAGQSVTLQVDSGASITLTPAGAVVIADAYGRSLIWGTGGGTQYEWDMGGASINVVNAANFTVNNKQIATVGAVDTDGDTLVTRGW